MIVAQYHGQEHKYNTSVTEDIAGESASSGVSYVMIINVRSEICLMLSYVYRVPNTVIRPRPSCPLLCITFFIVIIIIIIFFFILLLFMVIVNKKRKLAGRTSSGGVAFSCLCLPSLGEVGPRYTLCTPTNVGVHNTALLYVFVFACLGVSPTPQCTAVLFKPIHGTALAAGAG